MKHPGAELEERSARANQHLQDGRVIATAEHQDEGRQAHREEEGRLDDGDKAELIVIGVYGVADYSEHRAEQDAHRQQVDGA